MHKPAAIALGLAGLLTICVPLAVAELVPNRSISGIELRMTRAEVVAAAGEPDAERVRDAEIFGRQRVMRYGKTKAYFSGKRPSSEVVALVTRDRAERTSDGIGIGSRKRAIKRSVAGVRCKREFGINHCFKGRFRPGKRITDFFLNDRNRAKRITVGIVID
jgi:hypothetical protein